MEAPKAEFDVEKVLREILSDGKESPPIFDRLLERFENFSERPVSSLGDLKRRDNKRAKGLGWEKFCQFYLSRVMGYQRVWLWNEIPDEVRVNLKLKSRIDNGIDLVAQYREGAGYVAVQCKYRKKIAQTVTWTVLSTFIGLCAVTGPWEKQIVMTNCKGVSRRNGVEKTKKDQTIAYGTFSKLTRDRCTMAASGTELHYRCARDETDGEAKVSIPKTQEELRTARLAKFSSQ